MAASANTKTLWLLLLGAALVAFLLLPIRLTPVVPQTIDTLTVQTRAQLIKLYETPARRLRVQADSLRQLLTRRYGGTRPTQDSLLQEMSDQTDQMLEIVDHLRDPRRATFEEKRQDIRQLLHQLQTRASQIGRQLVGEFIE